MPNWFVTKHHDELSDGTAKPEPTNRPVGTDRSGEVLATWTEAKNALLRLNGDWLDAHRNAQRHYRALRKPEPPYRDFETGEPIEDTQP